MANADLQRKGSRVKIWRNSIGRGYRKSYLGSILYIFKTGKKVHNVIQAELVCKDGKIVKHTDQFGFYRWSRQALGLPGLLFGFLPFLKNKIRTEARKGLDLYLKRQK
ncbi:hypothetical protein LEP1GSC150_4322 [Leptospira interrogans serovar Copenhageni str. LT2050]|uniref:Uncharacterized protein n=1 Tax=Leptospira interrogans serovar Copenhageni str. LT2050 TaxID=1001598 RepID=M3IG12_LEPIT|nr:hypothetical protein LEP1GSC150_4322 [Leptospira interrogans serovar Copenhageni str. LT2050]